ncbi:MAG: PspC domain-containing protein [Nocardioidaceae bacterium]
MSETVVRARRAYRDPEDRFLGGVASGLADHLGVEPLHARVGFVLLTVMGGFGVVVYAALWILLPVADCQSIDSGAAGLDAASRRGMRSAPAGRRTSDVGVAMSLTVVGLGALVLLQVSGLWGSPRVFWPLLVASAGIALLWWQSDERARTDWLSPYSGWKSWLRILAGAGLLAGAVSLALFQAGVADALDDALGAIALAVAGVGLVIGPWLLRLTRELRRERAERVRSQERADVAAHLHDSVLQTLAMIQRRATDSASVSQLARTQERELRTWLFETDETAADTLKSTLQRTVAEVEAAHQVPVELVSVGDVALDEGIRALAAASREAIANAARHSGSPQVDVYVEVLPDGVDVFVRDRGSGFVLADVAEDRLGVRRSIVDRVARHGGRAEIRSGDGDGTEIKLRMPTHPTRGQQS